MPTVTNRGLSRRLAGTMSPKLPTGEPHRPDRPSTEIDGVTSEDGSGGATTLARMEEPFFRVGSTGSLALTNGSSFTQSGGTFTNHGAFSQNTGTFTQSGGADTGHHVLVIDATLNDSAGSGSAPLSCSEATASVARSRVVKTVDVIGNGTYDSSATLVSDLTNDGNLDLNAGTTPGSGFADLAGLSYTVTNAGTIKTAGGVNNPNYLRTNVTNTSGGTVDIDGVTNEDGSGGATTFTNDGAFSVGLTKGSLAFRTGPRSPRAVAP